MDRIKGLLEVNEVCVQRRSPLIHLLHDVAENEDLLHCAPIPTEPRLFFSEGLIHSPLDPIDYDSAHDFAHYWQQCHSSPVFTFVQVPFLW